MRPRPFAPPVRDLVPLTVGISAAWTVNAVPDPAARSTPAPKLPHIDFASRRDLCGRSTDSPEAHFMTTHLTAHSPGALIDPAELESVCATLLEPNCAPTGTVRLGHWILEYAAPRAFAHTLQLLFGARIYDVAPLSGPARIIDGGGWLGLSVLRFRQLFPNAHITVFEPDPDIYRLMCRNIERNGLRNVKTVQAALSKEDGQQTFMATGSDSGSLVAAARGDVVTVPTRRLSPYVDEPVSLLKLNVEGAEADVIAELGSRLTAIDQILIEYHGFAELPQSLHTILASLHEAGHTYVVSHFNDTNRACVPPLRVTENYRYFLLIYSRRLTPLRAELAHAARATRSTKGV